MTLESFTTFRMIVYQKTFFSIRFDHDTKLPPSAEPSQRVVVRTQILGFEVLC